MSEGGFCHRGFFCYPLLAGEYKNLLGQKIASLLQQPISGVTIS
jgi:hypothetical protein